MQVRHHLRNFSKEMNELIIIFAAILPGIILCIYLWKQDPYPEPALQLIKAAIFGMVTCAPVFIVESALQIVLFGDDASPTSLFGTTTEAFLIAGLVEESFKLLTLWLILSGNRYYDEHIDGIVYAVFVGLGFAMSENILYLFADIENRQSTAFFRAIFAVPAHYAFAILMGYYYSIYHFVDRSNSNLLKILFIPVLAHGIYDAIVLSANIVPSISFTLCILLVCFCYKMHKFARDKVEEQLENDGNGLNNFG